MSYEEYFKETPKGKKIEEFKKKKAQALQDKILKAVESTKQNAPVEVYDLLTGKHRYEIVKRDDKGNKYTAYIKYKVNGKYYVSSTEIAEEYGLKSRQTVFVRLHSSSKKWKDWIEL